jgi:hypothetical protein
VRTNLSTALSDESPWHGQMHVFPRHPEVCRCTAPPELTLKPGAKLVTSCTSGTVDLFLDGTLAQRGDGAAGGNAPQWDRTPREGVGHVLESYTPIGAVLAVASVGESSQPDCSERGAAATRRQARSASWQHRCSGADP